MTPLTSLARLVSFSTLLNWMLNLCLNRFNLTNLNHNFMILGMSYGVNNGKSPERSPEAFLY